MLEQMLKEGQTMMEAAATALDYGGRTVMEAAATSLEHHPVTTVMLGTLVSYMAVIQLLRFRRVRSMKMSDVKKDASAVYRQSALLEFPFTVTKSVDFSLFRTYGIPSISRLFNKNRQFQMHVGKRYDDTDILIKEYSENNPVSERSNMAMARMNAIHAVYQDQISNADMLYTMSLFITEPMAWIDRIEWRRSTDVEKAAFLAHFQEMGTRMGIKGLREWNTWEEADAFTKAYEAEHYRYEQSNSELVKHTLDLFLSGIPKFLHPLGRAAVCVLIDPPLLKAVGLKEAPLVLKWIVNGAITLRVIALRFFTPPRSLPYRRTPGGLGDMGIPTSCPASSAYSKDAKGDPAASGDADMMRTPVYNEFHDTKLGCLFHKDGYQISKVGTRACPAGRLMWEGVPVFRGKGGGGNSTSMKKASSAVPTDGPIAETKKGC